MCTKDKCTTLYYQAFCLSVHFLLHHMVSSIETASSNKCDQKNHVHRGFIYLKDQRQDQRWKLDVFQSTYSICDRKGKNTGKVQSITHGHISLRENDRGLQKER